MQEEMMTAGNGGFSGSADATGPNAGYDPVMKFRRKVKSKKDKKLVMPGNELKAEDNRSYQEKLDDVILEKQLERINKLREQGYDLSEEQINEFLGGVLKGVGNAVKGVMGSKPKPSAQKPSAPAPASMSGSIAGSTSSMGQSPMSSVAGGKIPPSVKFGGGMSGSNAGGNLAKFDASGKSRFQRGIGEFAPKSSSPSSATPAAPKKNAMQAGRPGYDSKGVALPKKSNPNVGGALSSAASVLTGVKKKQQQKNKLSAMKEAASAPCDRPSRLYQYKVTVPEMGTTIIYGSSPTELMLKFRMLFNPRFIKQIKIERVTPFEAGEIFYDKRMKHIRNIKPN